MSTQRLQLIASSLSAAFLKKIGASNAQAVSGRSMRFDIAAAKQGVNRIKITEMGGTVNIQFLQITELDIVAGVLPENIEAVIAAFTALEGETVPMSTIDAVLEDFKISE